MRARIVAAVAVVVLAACTQPAAPAALCATLANAHGVMYTAGGSHVTATAVSPTAFAEIAARKQCVDVNPQAGDNQPLQPGESNFLPVGTTLHTIDGFSGAERLAYLAADGVWRVMVPLVQSD